MNENYKYIENNTIIEQKNIKTNINDKFFQNAVGTLNIIGTLNDLLIDDGTKVGTTYSCTSNVDCIISKNTWFQIKNRTITIDYTFSKKVKISHLDWFFNLGSPNTNKYPRNIAIYYYNENNVLIPLQSISGLQRNIDQKIDINDIGIYSNKYRFIFTGSTDQYGYTAIQYLIFNGIIEP